MSFFISDAIAATSASGPQEGGMLSFVMIGAIFILFYFMLIRPQNKRAKEHRELISKLKKGDEVVTSSGVLGKIAHLDEQYIKLTVAEGIDLNMQRGAITNILPKGTLKSI